MSEAADQAAEELYGLPPGEFIGARDERAKELRAHGDREAAAEVKALRKPTVAAWAVNALARRRRSDLDRLLEAGEALRSAQAELLEGGDRSAFQEAASTERELVAKLAGEAVGLVEAAGERPGAGLEEKVAGTLHAAAIDDETAEELRAGRLVREREASAGFGGLPLGAACAPRPRGRAKSRTRATQRPKQAGKRDERSGAAHAEERAAAARAKERLAAARAKERLAAARAKERLAAARTDERHQRRELEAAARALRSAETRAEAAAAHAADAVERARTAAERLGEARRKESAARKAHARAERALKDAERA